MAAERWQLLTYFKERMFSVTSTEHAPWFIIDSDNKQQALLNAIHCVLVQFGYEDSGLIHPSLQAESEDQQEFLDLLVDGVLFTGLNREQVAILERPQMKAAGGLVLSGGHGLLIRKHHLWDLPKGKLSGDEKPERCAVREISEETGLQPRLLSIRAPICRSTYISYYSYGPVNKTVDWYFLDYAGEISDPLTPQFEEDIDLCQWVAYEDLLKASQGARSYLRPVWRAIKMALCPSVAGNPVA